MMCGAAFVKLGDGDFKDRVVECGRPALVFFSAAWSQPCKLMEERLGKILPNYRERLLAFVADVDESPKPTAAFEIKSVPTLLLMHGARVMEKFVGCKTPEELEEFVSKTLSDTEDVMRSESEKEG